MVITIARILPGRRSGTRCVRPTPRLRQNKRCRRYKRIGALTRPGVTGANEMRFTGRIGRKALARGRYRAAIVETTPGAARPSARRTATFRIVAP